jgi:hypothetical protein
MRPKATGVHHPLRDTLMVEVEELLAQGKIFECSGATCPDLERILVVGYRDTLLRSQCGCVAVGNLVHFAASAGHDTLISVMRRFALAGSILDRGTGSTFFRHVCLLSLIYLLL